MELSGKTVAFLGDSITEGVGVSAKQNRFTDVFSRISGSKQLNYGVSGTRIARQIEPSSPPEWDYDFLSRADIMTPRADVVVVFGGTNDFGHGDAPIGEFSDTSEYTFFGALHSLYKKLIKKYPLAEIVVLTPLHRTGERERINEFGRPREPLKKYVEAIRETAEYYSLPVLDLYKISGFQPETDIIREKYMPDGLHPSDAGAAKIAERLKNFLSSL